MIEDIVREIEAAMFAGNNTANAALEHFGDDLDLVLRGHAEDGDIGALVGHGGEDIDRVFGIVGEDEVFGVFAAEVIDGRVQTGLGIIDRHRVAISLVDLQSRTRKNNGNERVHETVRDRVEEGFVARNAQALRLVGANG